MFFQQIPYFPKLDSFRFSGWQLTDPADSGTWVPCQALQTWPSEEEPLRLSNSLFAVVRARRGACFHVESSAS